MRAALAGDLGSVARQARCSRLGLGLEASTPLLPASGLPGAAGWCRRWLARGRACPLQQAAVGRRHRRRRQRPEGAAAGVGSACVAQFSAIAPCCPGLSGLGSRPLQSVPRRVAQTRADQCGKRSIGTGLVPDSCDVQLHDGNTSPEAPPHCWRRCARWHAALVGLPPTASAAAPAAARPSPPFAPRPHRSAPTPPARTLAKMEAIRRGIEKATGRRETPAAPAGGAPGQQARGGQLPPLRRRRPRASGRGCSSSRAAPRGPE